MNKSGLGSEIEMNPQKPYSIKKVGKEDSEKVKEFMIKMRKELFPMLSQTELPMDLLHFEQHYIQHENAGAYAAFFQDGEVVGTIGITPYDGRFEQLQKYYNQTPTAEIVKCYIDKDYRRLGIGTKLFDEALRFSCDSGYQTLYLHTHPFLPGGIPFWKSKGFEDRLVEDDPIWNTLHMDREIQQQEL